MALKFSLIPYGDSHGIFPFENMDLAAELSLALANPDYIFESVKFSQTIRKQTQKNCKKYVCNELCLQCFVKARTIFLEHLPD